MIGFNNERVRTTARKLRSPAMSPKSDVPNPRFARRYRASPDKSPPVVPPSEGGTAGGDQTHTVYSDTPMGVEINAGVTSPIAASLEGVSATGLAGSFASDVVSPLEGVEAKAEAGDFVTARFVPPPAGEVIRVVAQRPLVRDADTLDASAEQRPAAYRFELRDGKIDVLPEAPEPEDREFALDTYRELVAKARELHERLNKTNSARHVCDGVRRLLTALDTGFDDLRPGVLLSRERSIAADRAAFDNDEARGELFPDAFAMLDDTLQTLRDLLAAFPIVRRIEAERLALELDRNSDAVPFIRQQMAEIRAAAAKSEAVTDGAVASLAQNEEAIEAATGPLVRTSLIGDELLVYRNFGAVIGRMATYGRKAGAEVAALGKDVWAQIRVRLPMGAGTAAELAPTIALLALAGWISNPFAGIAAGVVAFRPVAQILNSFSSDGIAADEMPAEEKVAEDNPAEAAEERLAEDKAANEKPADDKKSTRTPGNRKRPAAYPRRPRIQRSKRKEGDMVTVHHFRVWDIMRGEYLTPSLKSTTQRIQEVKGEIIPETAEEVERSALDKEGRYDPKRSGS